MPSIAERMIRRQPADLIYIGDLVEKHCFLGEGKPSEFLQLLKALTEGRAEQEVLATPNGVSAETILGRVQMAFKLVNDLQQFVIDRDDAKRPIKRKRKAKVTPLASEPSSSDGSPNFGGEI